MTAGARATALPVVKQRKRPVAHYRQAPELLFDVLRLIAEGCSNAEIGRRLGIAEDTVKSRPRALYHLLGARDRAHAVSIGYQSGVLKVQR